MNVQANGLFGVAEWLAVGGGLIGLIFVLAMCPANRRWDLALGAFSTGAAIAMFFLLGYAIAIDKPLFDRTVSSSVVSVFAAFVYSAAVSMRALWDMREKPQRYYRRLG